MLWRLCFYDRIFLAEMHNHTSKWTFIPLLFMSNSYMLINLAKDTTFTLVILHKTVRFTGLNEKI